MTIDEKEKLRRAVKKIPCALAISTDQGNGAAWLECRECPRCILLHALHAEDPFGLILKLMERPDNGGYELRDDLKKPAHGSVER